MFYFITTQVFAEMWTTISQLKEEILRFSKKNLIMTAHNISVKMINLH